MSDSQSPYEPPSSDLVTEKKVPNEYLAAGYTPGKLKFPAVLTVIYLLLSIPYLYLSFYQSNENSPEWYAPAADVLMVITALIWCYLLWCLRWWLEQRFHLKGLRTYVNMLIGLSVVLVVMSLVLEGEFDQINALTITFTLLMIPYGILVILFARTIRPVAHLFPYLSLFVNASILQGVLIATMIFYVLSIPVGLFVDVLLALIFFHAARELEQLPHQNRNSE